MRSLETVCADFHTTLNQYRWQMDTRLSNRLFESPTQISLRERKTAKTLGLMADSLMTELLRMELELVEAEKG